MIKRRTSRFASRLALCLFAAHGADRAAAQQAQPPREVQQTPQSPPAPRRPAPAAAAQGQPGEARPAPKPSSVAVPPRDETNLGVVTVISGGLNGTYARIASDLASVLDDGNDVRIIPMLGKGAVQNVKDILFLKGVDLGLVRIDSLEAIRREGKIPNVEGQLTYIARIMNDEMHVITSKEITDFRQLVGKKVNIDVVGSGSHWTSTLIFERMGLNVEKTTFEQADAYEKLRRGEIDASIFWGGKPVRGIADFQNDGRFHLLSVPYDPELQDLYLPAALNQKDYPNLVAEGQTVETIGASTVLAAYNWKKNTERYRKVAKFVEAFFSKFDQFLKPPRHPKWTDANLAASVPGWRRFPAAQEWLDRQKPQSETTAKAEFDQFISERERKTGIASSKVNQNSLFQEFLDWQRTRPRGSN